MLRGKVLGLPVRAEPRAMLLFPSKRLTVSWSIQAPNQARGAGLGTSSSRHRLPTPLLCLGGPGDAICLHPCGIWLFPCVWVVGFLFSKGVEGGAVCLGNLPTCISQPLPCRICNLAEPAVAGWRAEAEKGARGCQGGASPTQGYPGASCPSPTCIKSSFPPTKLGS